MTSLCLKERVTERRLFEVKITGSEPECPMLAASAGSSAQLQNAGIWSICKNKSGHRS